MVVSQTKLMTRVMVDVPWHYGRKTEKLAKFRVRRGTEGNTFIFGDSEFPYK